MGVGVALAGPASAETKTSRIALGALPQDDYGDMGIIKSVPFARGFDGSGWAPGVSLSTSNAALFDLAQPAFPGRNECQLDGGAFQPCSFFFSATNLSAGTHVLTVRQTSAAGAISTDSVAWQVSNAPAGRNPQVGAYCQQDYGLVDQNFRRTSSGSTTTYESKAFESEFYVTGFNPTQQPVVTLPNTFSKGVGARAWDIGLYNGFMPLFNATTWSADPADNTWVPGLNGPYSIPDVSYVAGQRNMNGDPSFAMNVIDPRGVTIEDLARSLRAPFNIGYAQCLQVHPPAAIVDNGDGTLSATFGWTNLGAYTISTTSSGAFDRSQHLLGQSLVSDGGTTSTPAGMPTIFGANSSGVWTYTFPRPAADSATPVTWTVGRETAGFHVRLADLTPAAAPVAGGAAAATITPFTHVNAQTPQVAPARPVSAPAQGVKSAPASRTPGALDASGGAVNTLTRLQISSKVTSPRNRTVKPGQLIHFTSTLRNVGTVDAVNPRICDTIPVGMTFVSAPGREIKGKGRQVCWTSTRLAAGTAVTGTMTLRATKSARRGSRTNTIRATATNSCTVTGYTYFFVGTGSTGKSQNALAPMAWAGTATSPLPDAAREQQVGSNAPGIAKLKVATRVLTPKARSVARGKTLSIRGTLTNTSTADARNVRLCERIPVGMTVLRAPFFGKTSARTICWSRPELKAGEKVSGVTVLRATTNAKPGVRANLSTVSAVNACPVKSRTTFRVRP
jgi:uncharacterized repeat protein (TIGR01451 family)